MEYDIWKKKEDLKKNSSRVWGKNIYRSKKIEKVRYDSSAAAHTGTTLELNYTSSKSTNIQDGCLLISLVTIILTYLYIRALCPLWRTS